MARSVNAKDPDMAGPIPKDYVKPASAVLRLTNYCSSRWYRSPEQLINARNYGTAIDMWSLGCVVGEMFQRKPIFPGTCSLMQLSLIVHLTGRPPDVDLSGINSKHVVQILEGLGNSKQGQISDIVPNGSGDAQDLIHLCLQFNPDKRITATEALEHPFLGHFHNPDAEPNHPSADIGGVTLPLSEDVQYSVNAYRDQIYSDFLGNERIRKRMQADRFIRENLLDSTRSFRSGKPLDLN
jgi:mitogen-activated protein kinase 15